MQWARVSPDAVVVATAERAWLHNCRVVDLYDPFAQPMQGCADASTTARLLDGALGAGVQHAPRRVAPPPLSRLRWIWRLVGYYHLTTHTPGWMRQAADGFESAGRPTLAGWARDKADDEDQHDRLALKDLDDLGVDGHGLVAAVIPPTVEHMLRYFRTSVEAALPLDCIGYAHTVERLAVAQKATYVASVRAVLPPNSRAWRSLRVHSALGSDVGHVTENVNLIAGLPAPERSRIALACYEVAKLLSTTPVQGHIEDAQLEQLIEPWRRHGREHA